MNSLPPAQRRVVELARSPGQHIRKRRTHVAQQAAAPRRQRRLQQAVLRAQSQAGSDPERESLCSAAACRKTCARALQARRSAGLTFQGIYGEWTLEDSDRREVRGYRVGLSVTAAAIVLDTLLPKLSHFLPASSELQPTLRCVSRGQSCEQGSSCSGPDMLLQGTARPPCTGGRRRLFSQSVPHPQYAESGFT